MVIPRMYYNAKRNLPIEIFGDGTQTRDFTYIEDAINATLSVFFTSTPGFEVYNVANGEEHSINDVANMMLHATHSDSAIKHIPNPPNRADYEVSRRWGCSDKLFAHTGFKPNTKLEDGLRKFVESCY